jgi:hypothetical protein
MIQVFGEQKEQRDHQCLSDFSAALWYEGEGRAEGEEGEDFAICEQLSPGCVPCDQKVRS